MGDCGSKHGITVVPRDSNVTDTRIKLSELECAIEASRVRLLARGDSAPLLPPQSTKKVEEQDLEEEPFLPA